MALTPEMARDIAEALEIARMSNWGRLQDWADEQEKPKTRKVLIEVELSEGREPVAFLCSRLDCSWRFVETDKE